MKEYIEREALKEVVSNLRFGTHLSKDAALNLMDRAIDNLPAADVVERKCGKWVVTECDSGEPEGYPAFIEFHCPYCNEPYSLESGEYDWHYGDAIPFKFCHECGADMREVDYDETD